VLSWDTRRISQAALEVLAIVAYSQPVTRAQIAQIRGVNSESPLNTLIERGYVREAGNSDAAGNPTLYATTREFLEKFGLRDASELPDLADFAPDEKTADLIRERLGAPRAGDVPEASDLPRPEQLVADAAAKMLGTVEKIDFDQLEFDTDDE
jgi:segregation and condensation protein B